jgi:hypothetical protein
MLAHLRNGRPLGAKASAWPCSTTSLTRDPSSLTTRLPLRWSQLAKESPSRQRQGKPIIVDRVTPARSRRGSANVQNLTSPGVGFRSVTSADLRPAGTRAAARGPGPGSFPSATAAPPTARMLSSETDR